MIYRPFPRLTVQSNSKEAKRWKMQNKSLYPWYESMSAWYIGVLSVHHAQRYPQRLVSGSGTQLMESISQVPAGVQDFNMDLPHRTEHVHQLYPQRKEHPRNRYPQPRSRPD